MPRATSQQKTADGSFRRIRDFREEIDLSDGDPHRIMWIDAAVIWFANK
jgi:hypothetical protein